MSWWPAPTCSTPAAAAARTRSVPSCPVAPRMSSRSEDDIVLHHVLQRVVPLDQALVPVDRSGGGPVVHGALLERPENLLGAVLWRETGRIAQPVADLLEAHSIRPVVGVAIPIFDIL